MSSTTSSTKPRKASSDASKHGKSSSSGKGQGFIPQQIAAKDEAAKTEKTSEDAPEDEEVPGTEAAVRVSSQEKRLLMRGGPISMDDVRALKRATAGYLVKPTAVTPVAFRRLRVTMGEGDQGMELFDQQMNTGEAPEAVIEEDSVASAAEASGEGEELCAAASEISYELPADVLGAMCTAYVEFSASREVKCFVMAERFFFGDILLKELIFDFGFCIPNSINTASITYDVPEISADLRAKIVANPGKVRGDSFYFEDGALFMHYKSKYTYMERK